MTGKESVPRGVIEKAQVTGDGSAEHWRNAMNRTASFKRLEHLMADQRLAPGSRKSYSGPPGFWLGHGTRVLPLRDSEGRAAGPRILYLRGSVPTLLVCAAKKLISHEATGCQELINRVVTMLFS